MTGLSTVLPGSTPPRPGRVTTQESPFSSGYGEVSVTVRPLAEFESPTRKAPHVPQLWILPSRKR